LKKATDVLSLEDIELIATATAKIHTNLGRLRKRYSSPEEFGEKGITQFIHRDNLFAFSLLFNINDINPNNYYKPEHLREMVLQQIRSHSDDAYSSIDYLLSGTSYSKVNALDMYKSLEELGRIIDLKKVEKKDIRKIAKRYKIKFSGKPSLYQFPNNLTILKRIYSNPIMGELIIRSLVTLGLVDDLSFFLEGMIHSLLNNYQEKRAEAANKVFDIVTKTYPLFSSDTDGLNISNLNPFRGYLLSVAKSDLSEFVRKTALHAVENPVICLPILILFLFEINK
jgi:hypothetical protein